MTASATSPPGPPLGPNGGDEKRPGTGTLPEPQVRAMFDRIARVYDRMNAIMTAGLDRRWRERAPDLADLGPGGQALDVAPGTRDPAFGLARPSGPGARVGGVDFSENMLALARNKAAAAPGPVIPEFAAA